MGMYDNFYIPTDNKFNIFIPHRFKNEPFVTFQTKQLSCDLIHYEFSREGYLKIRDIGRSSHSIFTQIYIDMVNTGKFSTNDEWIDFDNRLLTLYPAFGYPDRFVEFHFNIINNKIQEVYNNKKDLIFEFK
jgi:hypothetical protein